MPASVPGTAWSGIPDASPPGPWSSAWRSTDPPRAVVPRDRTYDNPFAQSPRKRLRPVLLHGKLVLQGNVKSVGKLRFSRSASPPRSIRFRGQRKRVEHEMAAGFRNRLRRPFGVIAVLAVMLTVQLFAGAIGGSSHSRLSGAVLNPGRMKMIQCDSQSPPNSFLLCSLMASMSRPLTSVKANAFPQRCKTRFRSKPLSAMQRFQ